MDDPPRPLSCDDYLEMPFGEEVVEHLRTCESCRSVFNRIADELDRYLFERQHRN
jgi:predicted anti-sigma-YlaC factor YlaD